MKLKKKVDLLLGKDFFRKLFISEMSQQDIQSMGMLSSLLPNKLYNPMTSYTLSPTTIVHILNEIILLKRKTIVEFGSGVSTLFIARLLSYHKLNATLFSIDHEKKWQNVLQSSLDTEGTGANVKLICAGLESSKGFENQECRWYSKSLLGKKLPEKIDLVIVDGPPFSTGQYSRYFAVPFLKNRLLDDYSIFLDDVFRKGESDILNAWENILGVNPINYIRYAVFTTNNKVSTVPISLSYNYKYDELIKIK